LTQGDRMLVTPTGHVYEMYAPHQGGTAVRMRVETDMVEFKRGEKTLTLPVVAGSASVQDNRLFVTLTNSHAEKSEPVVLDLLNEWKAGSVQGRVLAGEVHAHNTFDKPESIQPVVLAVAATGSQVKLELPPAAVVSIEVALK